MWCRRQWWSSKTSQQLLLALCENLNTHDEPEARARMIWIIGEYAENPPSLRQDLGGAAVPRGQGGAPAPDILVGGLDQMPSGGPHEPTTVAASNSLLGDIFGMGEAVPAGYIAPKQVCH